MMSRTAERAAIDRARFDAVSIPVYAIIAIGIARAKSVQVGAVPQWMLSARMLGLKIR